MHEGVRNLMENERYIKNRDQVLEKQTNGKEYFKYKVLFINIIVDIYTLCRNDHSIVGKRDVEPILPQFFLECQQVVVAELFRFADMREHGLAGI